MKKIIAIAIEKDNALEIKMGLCDQAPSNFLEFVFFLMQNGINSILYSQDALLKGI